MRSVCFLIVTGGICGGTNVLFNHALHLIRQGVDVSFVCARRITREDTAWHAMHAAYDDPALHWLDYGSVIGRRFDVCVATYWSTFYDLYRVDAASYCYFVQSIESRFFDVGNEAVRAFCDGTYDLSIGYVTEARWIVDYLESLHGQRPTLAPNGIDKGIFVADGPLAAPRLESGMRVLVEGPLDLPYKNVAPSIYLARAAGATEVWLLTSSDVGEVPGVDRVFSRIPHRAAPEVYRACDVLVKLSTVEGMFGPPLEMFHCGGTSVVYDVTGHDEYIRDGANGIVVPTDDHAGVVSALRRLKEDPGLRARLAAEALRTAAAWPDWDRSSALFMEALGEAAAACAVSRHQLKRYATRLTSIYYAGWRERRRLEQAQAQAEAPARV